VLRSCEKNRQQKYNDSKVLLGNFKNNDNEYFPEVRIPDKIDPRKLIFYFPTTKQDQASIEKDTQNDALARKFYGVE